MATAATTAIVQVTVDVAVDEDPAAMEGGEVGVIVTGEELAVDRSSKTAAKSYKLALTPLQLPLV